jgi:hypothetical protein
MSRVITRFSAGLVQAYDFSIGVAVTSDVDPAVAFPITEGANLKPDSCAVAPDLSCALAARVIGAAERLQPLPACRARRSAL